MKKVFFLIPFFFNSFLYSEIIETSKIDFGKGLNLKDNITNILDNQSPDMCDCISNLDGSTSERFGNKEYISQARSTQPIKNLYRAYASSGSITKKILIAINGNEIIYSSDDINPQWIQITSGITSNQNWSFVTMNNDVIMTGDGLVNPIYKFNILTSSFSNLFNTDSSSESVVIRAKYLLQERNHLFFINCADITNGTTYYPSRVYFSLLNKPSSTTYNRILEIRTNDGEELTGGGAMFGKVNFFKPSTIAELDFSVLNLVSLGGDQTISEIVNGFGLKAPRTLQNLGLFYVLGSQDSIRLWDGGRRSRLNSTEEEKSISVNIQPLIDKLIKNKTYENMVCKYYKKREWLIFSYNDPDKFPKEKNNSVIVYDFKIGEWFPLCGILAESFETFDSIDDDGTLLYGNSNDGFVYFMDKEESIEDPPKQIFLDTMDSTVSWTGTNININWAEHIEGTGSIRMWISPSVLTSSITIIKNFNMGEFYDKTKVIKSTGLNFLGDKIQFKVNSTSFPNITNLRIDLLVDDISGTVFNNNFTSVTFTSSTLLSYSSVTVNGTTWSIVEVPLSSFPIRTDWVSFESETLPFANTLFYYGLRFSLEGINISSVSIDDCRIVQEKNPINFYRFTKFFDFGTLSEKTFGQILLTMGKQKNSTLKIDIYNNFGENVRTVSFDNELENEILVLGLVSTASISAVDAFNFSIKRSTILNEKEIYPFNGVADNKYIYFYNRISDNLVKMDRKTFVIISTFGSLGSGTTNFNLVHQMDIDENGKIYSIDLNNQRVKVNFQNDLSFIQQAGSLGSGNTSYHQPTGITVNKTEAIVADEGNYFFKKIGISTLGFVLSKIADYNTIGDTTLEQDENFYYDAYNKISDEKLYYQNIVLEKRFKGNLELVNRILIYPNDSVVLSTYALRGDIAILGDFIYIPFTDNTTDKENAKYYIQKRLKSNFSLVKEYKTNSKILSILGDSLAHKPSISNFKKDLLTSGKYIQLKYYDSGIESKIDLLNQTFLLENQGLKY